MPGPEIERQPFFDMWASVGITEENSKLVVFGSLKEASASLIEGRMDAFTYSVTATGAAEIDRAIGLHLVTPSPEMIDAVTAAQPAHSRDIMPADLAGNVEKVAIPTYKHISYVVARKDIPEDVVYTILKALYDNWDDFATSHPNTYMSVLEDQLPRLPIPAHPGLIKFLKERGLWTNEWEEYNKKQLG